VENSAGKCHSGFSMMSSIKIDQIIVTTTDYQKLQDWRPKRLYCHFRLSVVVAFLSQGQFHHAERGRKPQIIILSVIVSEI